MPLDTNVFSKLKGYQEFAQAEQEFQLKKQLAARKMEGGDDPAALQLANEYQRRMAMGDIDGANLLAQFAKTVDRGLVVGPDGSYGAAPGYAPAVGSIEATKGGMKRQAESNVDLIMKPKIGKETAFSEALGKGRGTQVIKNEEADSSLDNLTFSIGQAKALLPKVTSTGPIMGRAGALAEDPDYRNLQGAINSITLQAKDLYNLGSGQGFTDADRKFLQEVIAGKYARSETIGLGLDRMEEALQHRQQYMAQQNARLQGSPQNLDDLLSNYQGGGAKDLYKKGEADFKAKKVDKGAKLAPDGNYYVPDPNRPGKYLQVVQ